VPVVDQAEIDEVVMRVVDGLTDTDISLLAQNEELRQRGWTLARLYKTIGRLEQEGKLVRGQDEKYRRAGPSKGVAPPSKAITGKPPVEVAEEPTEEPEEAPPPKAAARKAPEPEPTPPAVDIMDPELAQLVADTVSGLTDADITQVAQSEIIRSRGLNLAKVYKIVSRLEKEGKLVRDADGKYQPPDKASTKAQAKEPKSFNWDQPLAARGKPEESRGLDDYKTFEASADKTIAPSKTPPPAVASPAEMMDIVAGAIVGQTDADIPQIAQQPALKARGLNLAKLYQIASRLEKEGRIARDDKGCYQLSISKPAPPAAETVPAKRFTSLEWSANLPWLYWQTFETKVLNKFTGEESLSITVAFRVGPGANLSSEKVEETRAALAGLLLDTALKSDPAEGAPGRFSSLEWSGALPVKNWEPYYAQVLSRFFAEKTLSIYVSLKVTPGTGITQAKADELASGLKDMSLPAALKLS
jgi:hypothetical protein